MLFLCKVENIQRALPKPSYTETQCMMPKLFPFHFLLDLERGEMQV